jgi:lipopolysaccharide transport system permease protein
MTAFPANPQAMFKNLWSYRSLIWQMSKREVAGRYRGSMMGLLWSFFNPVMMLAIYTFVFSVVFKAKWGVSASESKMEFATILFAGMIVYNLFAECISRAPNLILGNVNYVKKVVFPLDILPWVSLCAALFHQAISFAVLILFYAAINQSLNWTVLLFPFLMLPLIFMIMGVSWVLASVGVFLRDVAQTTGLLLTIMMFVSPIFYPIAALPQKYQAIMLLNPLTFIIEQVRDVLIWGKLPDFSGLLAYFVASLGIAFMGFAWFQKTRKGFADVL